MAKGQRKPVCFISHRYGDPALEACRQLPLPGGATPYIFDRVAETPDVGISSPLMTAIHDCDLLVYLDTEESLGRFWVGFERSYAARLGKPVYAFRPGRKAGLFSSPFTRDHTPPADPLVSLLVNLQVPDDVERMLRLLEFARARHRLEFLGVDRRQVDAEPRHLLDSTDNMQAKLQHGAIALLFLSTASIESHWHDYADAFTAYRAKKDFESPTGYTSQRFAALPPDRTLVCWLDPPDPARIHAALEKFEPSVWANYIRIVREAVSAADTCIPFTAAGAVDHVHLDNMIARTYWQALQADPALAAHFRAQLRGENRRSAAERSYFSVRPLDHR